MIVTMMTTMPLTATMKMKMMMMMIIKANMLVVQ